MKFVLCLFFLINVAFAQNTDGITSLLDVDRFHTYSQRWVGSKRSQGQEAIANAISKLTPREIIKLKLDPKKLSNSLTYDELILEILQKNYPDLKATMSEVAWGDNFYKRKLNESYRIVDPNLSTPSPTEVISLKSEKNQIQTISPAVSAEVLLDADSYVSERTTRAVFWDASQSQRRIELHVTSNAQFKADMEQRGAKILGLVETRASNYNPIYLIQDPNEKDFHYAITEISGNDRVKHLTMQSALVRWEVANGKLAPPPPIQIVGNAIKRLKEEEEALTQILKVLPKADHVLIGNKSAFERTVRTMGKLESIALLFKKSPDSFKNALTPQQVRLIERYLVDTDFDSFAMKFESEINKVYEVAEPLLDEYKIPRAPSPVVYDLDRRSYEVSDLILRDRNGKAQRWRTVSNVWGDEVLPIARALKTTDHRDIRYIGTAGALPGSGLEVGDLVVPQNTHDSSGKIQKINGRLIPSGSKSINVVTTVSSPFEETNAWLSETQKIAQAVEVETSYLSNVFDGPNDRLSVFLLISDEVGVEGKTLAEPTSSSNKRKKSQIHAISTILNDAEVAGPLSASIGGDETYKIINELAPNEDPLAKFQVYKEAEANGITSRDGIKKLLDAEKNFTTTRLLANIDDAEIRLARILNAAEEAGIRPVVAIGSNYLEGRWNPATEEIRINLEVSDPQIQKELEAIVANIKKEDKGFIKAVELSIGSVDGNKDWVKLPGFLDNPNGTLLKLYKDSAIGFGGLAATESRTGKLKFVQVGPPTKGRAIASLNYFAPDEGTEKLLTEFSSNPNAVEKFLNNKIKYINEVGRADKGYTAKLNKVSSLEGGALASITPDLTGDKLVITVNITPEGLKNPMVGIEEAIHLDQLLDASNGLDVGFRHPYQWAETVANAKAGSPRAMAILARLELEAAQTSLTDMEYLGKQLNVDVEKAKTYAKARIAHAEKIYKEASRVARAHEKKTKAAWAESKKQFDALEKGPVKLNDLVLNNDRKGVRNLLDKYLPWDVMEPSEKHAWKGWLDAIEKPDLSKRVLTFRGMEATENFISAKGGTNKAIFPTILTHNQGNYNRRLRSLATRREINGVYVRSNGTKNVPSMVEMMAQHAIDPVGSPFISTSNLETAKDFAKDKMVAMMVDERRLIPNPALKYVGETELLIVPIVFPDEIVHYEISKTENLDIAKFKADVEKKIGRKLKPHEVSSVSEAVLADYSRDTFKRAKELLFTSENLPAIDRAPGCSINGTGCDCVFKTLNALLK